MKLNILHSLLMGSLLPISPIASAQFYDESLIRNGNLERVGKNHASGWIEKEVGDNDSSFRIIEWEPYGRVLSVAVHDYSSGIVGWAFKPVHVTPRRIYVWESTFINEGVSAIQAEFRTRAGLTIIRTLDVLLWHTTDEWATLAYEFEAPSDAISVTVYHGLIGYGSIFSRDISLRRKRQ